MKIICAEERKNVLTMIEANLHCEVNTKIKNTNTGENKLQGKDRDSGVLLEIVGFDDRAKKPANYRKLCKAVSFGSQMSL